jgi:hypothetical protein
MSLFYANREKMAENLARLCDSDLDLLIGWVRKEVSASKSLMASADRERKKRRRVKRKARGVA